MLNQIFKILSGNMLAQLIQFFSLFFLTRLFLPEEYSALALAQSMATFLSVVFTLQLHNTIPMIGETNHRIKVYSTVLCQILIISALFMLLIFFSDESDAVKIGGVLGCLLALYNLNISMLNSNYSFGFVSVVYILRASLIVSFQFMFSLSRCEDRLILSVVLAEFLVHFCFFKNYKNINWQFNQIKLTIMELYKNRKDFYIFGCLSELVAISSFFLPLYLMNHKFGSEVSGNYGMASRLVWAPAILITSSVCQVLYSRLGKLELSEVLEYIKKIKISYLIIILSCISMLSFFLDPIYKLLLGDGWSLAIKMLPLLVIWACIYMVGSVYRLCYRLFSMQKVLLIIDVGYSVSIIFFALLFNFDVFDILGVIVLLTLITNVFTVLLFFYYSDKLLFKNTTF